MTLRALRLNWPSPLSLLLGVALGLWLCDSVRPWLPWSARYGTKPPRTFVEVVADERAVPAEPIAIPVDEQRTIFARLLESDQRAESEASRRLPIDCSPTDPAMIEATESEWRRIVQDQRDAARAEVLAAHALSKRQLMTIIRRGVRERWGAVVDTY